MDSEIIKRWNNKVGNEDIVIHLGDFGLGSEKEIKDLKNSLNGTIFLLKGNHDHKIKKTMGHLHLKVRVCCRPLFLGCSRIENCNISYDPMINHRVFNS